MDISITRFENVVYWSPNISNYWMEMKLCAPRYTDFMTSTATPQ
jgi:hypothetical protein